MNGNHNDFEPENPGVTKLLGLLICLFITAYLSLFAIPTVIGEAMTVDAAKTSTMNSFINAYSVQEKDAEISNQSKDYPKLLVWEEDEDLIECEYMSEYPGVCVILV